MIRGHRESRARKLFTGFVRRFEGHASLGISSILIQVATYGVIFSFKSSSTDEDFVFIIKHLSIASILASVASLRLEMVLFQAHGRVFREALVIPVLASAAGLSIVYLVIGPVISLYGYGNILEISALPVGLALAIQEIHNFLCIQEKRWRQLILIRLGQVAGFLVLAGTAQFTISKHAFIWGYGGALAIPLFAWVTVFYFKVAPREPRISRGALSRQQLKRGATLALTQLVSTSYVHVANLLSIYLLSPAKSADFTFLSRIATGPVTFIRQISGQIFLSECLRLEASGNILREDITSRMWRVMAYGTFIYSIFAILLLPLVFAFQNSLSIEHPHMLYPLFLVGLVQLAVSQASLVRFILHEDKLFFVVEVLRLVFIFLFLALLQDLDFPIRFALASGFIYGGYFCFLVYRLYVRFPTRFA